MKALAMKSETLPLSAARKVYRNTREVELIEAAVRGGEGRLSSAAAPLVVEDGCPHRPLGPGQAHGARRHHGEGGLVGQ